jgi:hypothetical protein
MKAFMINERENKEFEREKDNHSQGRTVYTTGNRLSSTPAINRPRSAAPRRPQSANPTIRRENRIAQPVSLKHQNEIEFYSHVSKYDFINY